jgi:hypothetical protein
MGWDVKATADSLAQGLPSLSTPSLQQITPETAASWIVAAIAVMGIATILTRLLPRLWRSIEDVMMTNWRLALLGSAALLLSAAGGWTTWDGMRNFTGESVLSAMFTFGIHGVMLIVAWLIGESFATGMNQMRGSYGKKINPPMVALTVLGGGLLITAGAIYTIRLGLSNDQTLYSIMGVGAALLIVALVIMFSKSDVVQPYAQGIRIMTKNAMLWVMFFACMATSVFFSFDSRFNVIFPTDQRERAAEIRTKKQVAGVVADIGDKISTQRIAEAERLFESAGWGAYEAQLSKLSKASEGADAEIEAHFTQQMEAHRSSIAEQQERIATATSGQAGLASKKVALTDELSRLKAERPTLAAELSQKKTDLDNRAKEVDAKRVEAMAEHRGVEGSLKEGKGPIYRQRMSELRKLTDYYRIGEERVKDAQKRLTSGDKRIAQIERELAGVDGELAKLQGEAETAKQRIAASEDWQLGREGQRVDPSRVRAAFETARAEFRQAPDVARLDALHRHCGQLYDAMNSTSATKERVRGIDCDPKKATEASAVIFALNKGLKAFATGCEGGDKIPRTGGVDSLLQFGRRCLQDSGLPSNGSTELAVRLSSIDLNRDDKAHNFVVTLNAFQDGNRLAYLALAIAIGIDSLIFMTGLFGANAVRSPLSDVPSLKARNSQQLNAMIETALLPDVFKKARLVSQAMHPIENIDGFSNEVRLDELDPETAVQVRDVLNAGAVIGAVRRHETHGRYLVRAELLEFLNGVIKRELERNGESARRGLALDQLEDQVRVALMPQVRAAVDFVMHQLDPINEQNGYTSEVYLDQISEEMQPPVLHVLNTGTTFDVVQRDAKNAERYYVHKDLYKTLARIRAREHMKPGSADQLAGHVPGAKFGGSLNPKPAQIAKPRRAITAAPSVGGSTLSDDEHRAHFVEILIESLLIAPETYSNIPHDAFATAVAASEAFVRVRHLNQSLDRELTERDEKARMALERTFGRLEASLRADDDWSRQLLRSAEQEVDQNWPVIMLLPKGPYESVLQRVVEQLEADNGAGELPVEQAKFYAAARRLLDVLGTSARDTEESWGDLELSFDQVTRPHTDVAFGDGKRTLN